MEQIINISIDTLKIHPRNTEFFDDIQGEQYIKFKKSIEEDGILTPLIVSPDMTIISGHQRYQASKDLGIKLIPVIIKEDLIDEDEKLKKLLATNFGRLKNDPVKQGRVFGEYEKLCGVYHGNHQKRQNVVSQEQIAKELGVDVRTLQRLKQLQTLSPDLQELISEGTVKYTTALSVWSKLSQEEQSKLIEDLGRDKIKTLTQKATEEYIAKNRDLEQQLKQEQSKPPKVIEKEIDNTDYTIVNKAKKLEENLSNKNIEIDRLKKKLELMVDKANAYEQDSNEYKKMKQDITYLTNQKDDLGRQLQAITDISALVVEIDHLIKNKLAPVRYSKSIREANSDEIVIRNLTEIINVVEGWCIEMKQYLPIENNYINANVVEVL